eukprot:scaffold7433_cov152-Isochrysis_galbana.AAC.2
MSSRSRAAGSSVAASPRGASRSVALVLELLPALSMVGSHRTAADVVRPAGARPFLGNDIVGGGVKREPASHHSHSSSCEHRRRR